MSQVTPLGDWILIRIEAGEKEPEPEGSVIVPESPEALKLERAVVERCGPGEADEHGRRRQLEVQAGQIVLVRPRAGYELPGARAKGERWLVKIDDIVATV